MVCFIVIICGISRNGIVIVSFHCSFAVVFFSALFLYILCAYIGECFVQAPFLFDIIISVAKCGNFTYFQKVIACFEWFSNAGREWRAFYL